MGIPIPGKDGLYIEMVPWQPLFGPLSLCPTIQLKSLRNNTYICIYIYIYIYHNWDDMLSASSQSSRSSLYSVWSRTNLTLWGRVIHICANTLTIIGSDNGLSPDRRQAIIWANVGILLIGPFGTNFSEILMGIYTFSFRIMHLKMPSSYNSASNCHRFTSMASKHTFWWL